MGLAHSGVSHAQPGPAAAANPAGAAAPGAVSSQPTAGHTASQGTEQSTRARIARLILENGLASAAGLSARLDVTPAAVRRHLDNLLAEGMIEVREDRRYSSRGRGRPARLFAITDAGRSAFEHAYDDLAASALRFLAERAGPDAVAEFAQRKISDLENRYRPVVEAAPAALRVQALAEALSADGYAATASTVSVNTASVNTVSVNAGSVNAGSVKTGPAAGAGEQLCQHHCPVAHVAAEFPQLCEAETEAFGRLLGTPVQRLATISRGDGICTTHVTAASLAHAHTSTTGSNATDNTQSGGISA